MLGNTIRSAGRRRWSARRLRLLPDLQSDGRQDATGWDTDHPGPGYGADQRAGGGCLSLHAPVDQQADVITSPLPVLVQPTNGTGQTPESISIAQINPSGLFMEVLLDGGRSYLDTPTPTIEGLSSAFQAVTGRSVNVSETSDLLTFTFPIIDFSGERHLAVELSDVDPFYDVTSDTSTASAWASATASISSLTFNLELNSNTFFMNTPTMQYTWDVGGSASRGSGSPSDFWGRPRVRTRRSGSRPVRRLRYRSASSTRSERAFSRPRSSPTRT